MDGVLYPILVPAGDAENLTLVTTIPVYDNINSTYTLQVYPIVESLPK